MGGQKCAPAPQGRYTIKPDKSLPAVEVLCDFSFDGGGWTIFAGINIRTNKMTVKSNAKLHVLNYAGKLSGNKYAPKSFAQEESSNLALNNVIAKSAWKNFDFMLFNRDHHFREVWEGAVYNGDYLTGCGSGLFTPYTAKKFSVYGHRIPLGCVQHGWQGGTSSPMYHSYACNGNKAKACNEPKHCTGCHRCFFTKKWSCGKFTTFFAVREPQARLPKSHPARGKVLPLRVADALKTGAPKASDCVPAAAGRQAFSERDATVLVCDGAMWQPQCKPHPPIGAPLPKSCFEVQQRMGGQRCAPAATGRYIIKPDKSLPAVEVLCDFSFDGGGWTIFAGINIRTNKMTVKSNAKLHVLNYAGKLSGNKYAPTSYAQTDSSNLALNNVIAKSAWKNFDFMLFNREHEFREIWEGAVYNGAYLTGCGSGLFTPYSAKHFKVYGHRIPLGCVQHGWQGGTSSPMYHSYACNGNKSPGCNEPKHCTGCHRCFFTKKWSCDKFTTFFAVREPKARLPKSHPARGKLLPLPGISPSQVLDLQRLYAAGMTFRKYEPKLRQCAGFSSKTLNDDILKSCYVYGNRRPMHVRLCAGSKCSPLTSIGHVTFSSPTNLESISGSCWNGWSKKMVPNPRTIYLHVCSESASGGVYNGRRGIVIYKPVCDNNSHNRCMHVDNTACSGSSCKMYWYYEP